MIQKQILSVLLALCISAGMCIGAMAAGPTLTVQQPDALPPVGESFTVEVDLSGRMGLAGAQMILQFEPAVVKCTEAKIGEAMHGMMTAANPNAAGVFTFQVIGRGDPGFPLRM